MFLQCLSRENDTKSAFPVTALSVGSVWVAVAEQYSALNDGRAGGILNCVALFGFCLVL